jgi:hypothetical protein
LTSNDEAILHCRYLTEQALATMLDAAGFDVIESWLFHVDARSFDELGGGAGIDERINADPALRSRMGVDVLVLAKARLNPP